MRSKSLLSRLLVRLILATAVAIVVALALLFWQFERATGNSVGPDLPRIMDEVIKLVRIDAAGKPTVTLPEDFPYAFDEDRFVVLSDHHGRAYQSIPAGHDRVYHPFSHELTDKPQYFEHRYVDAPTTYLGATQRVLRDGTEFWIQAVDEVSYLETLRYNSLLFFGEGLGVLIVLYLAIVALLSYQAVQSALGPIRRAAEEARQIAPGSGDKRIGIAELPEEVRPLAEAANTALDRMQKALLDQRRFTADAAHEILTPLAVIRAEAELLDDPVRSKAMLDEIDDLSEMAVQLLEIAEIDGMDSHPDQEVELSEIAEEVIARFARQLIDQGIEPQLNAPPEPVVIQGCPKGIRSAVNNVVKNVLQHAKNAKNLEVRVEPPGRIMVTDDGVGIDVADRKSIFQRFWRSENGEPGNHGLGLAIVARVVELHDGAITVTDGPGGAGTRIVLDFPCDHGAT